MHTPLNDDDVMGYIYAVRLLKWTVSTNAGHQIFRVGTTLVGIICLGQCFQTVCQRKIKINLNMLQIANNFYFFCKKMQF